jgi:hypothetical protein
MRRVLPWALLASLVFLVSFSILLAATRIYQVDECQYIYMARVLCAHQGSTFFTDASGFTLPFSWLDGLNPQSTAVFIRARILMAGIFWLNLILIALGTGEKLLSRGGLIALLAAATLAPLWDYGFEIRHDNVLLTGLLLMWFVLRVRPRGLQSYFIAGAIAVGLQFFAFKAFAYTAPLSLACLVFPPPAHKLVRWKLILAWIAGAIVSFLGARLLYGSLGLWEVYLTDLHGISGASVHTKRLLPWTTLARLFSQTPLLLASSLAALVVAGSELWRNRRAALNWDGNLPEALLFLGAFGVLLVNPNPYPYNLLQVVPFAFIFAFRSAKRVATVVLDRPGLLPACVCILIFVHLVPFWTATKRHLNRTNTRQEHLMVLAESLTDPNLDPVYDAIGMVPSRPSIDFRWFLHSLNIQSFTEGPGRRVRDLLTARPAAVFIPNYRTDWLTEEDHAFIRERYVSLADDFWVLGKVLPPGGGSFEIIHSGRYRIAPVQFSNLADSCTNLANGLKVSAEQPGLSGKLDGMPLADQVLQLTAGTHQLDTGLGVEPAIVWVGPRLEEVPRLDPGSHSALFVNWY